VICREVEDHTEVVTQLADSGVQVIFWPGQMRPDPAKPVQDPPEHVAEAQALAAATGAFIVQTNWPNALNRPEESENTGHSACVAPTGELLFRLPKQGFGVGVFNLGERTYSWHPCAA
jgi:predicted amidohydrolase